MGKNIYFISKHGANS